MRCESEIRKITREPMRFGEKSLLRSRLEIDFHDFRTRTSHNFIVIFFLTSFFINSIHQLVAVEDHCKFSMKNGRENSNNGNQEEGEKEKETLEEDQYDVTRGRAMRPLSFCVESPLEASLRLRLHCDRDWRPLFPCRAHAAIGAEIAVHAGPRFEVSGSDSFGGFLDTLARN